MTQDKSGETRLISSAKRGDRKAFDVLISRYKGLVNSIVFSNVRRSEETKDVVQEVFLRAFRFIGELDDREKFGPWIAQIAKMLSINWISRHKTMTSLESIDLEDPKLLYRQIAWRHTPHDRIVNTEMRQAVLRAIDSLQERYKIVLLLKYMEEMPYEKIAEMLDVSIATVRSRLYRAKAKLRGILRAQAGRQIEKHMTEQMEGLTPNMADVDTDYFAEDADLDTLLSSL